MQHLLRKAQAVSKLPQKGGHEKCCRAGTMQALDVHLARVMGTELQNFVFALVGFSLALV